MVVFTSVLLALCIVAAVLGRPEDDESKHWALIVAGSSGYDNYRHQVMTISSKRGHRCIHLTLVWFICCCVDRHSCSSNNMNTSNAAKATCRDTFKHVVISITWGATRKPEVVNHSIRLVFRN